MNFRDLVPWNRAERDRDSQSLLPVASLHRDVNRLFEEAFRDFGESPFFEIFPAEGVAKCVPKTTTLLSAYFSQNARRVFFAIAPSESNPSSHSGYLH